MTGTPRQMDAMEIFRRSRRFDLIFKISLAKAWAEGDDAAIRRAEEAYLESIRARNAFRESNPPKSGPAIYIASFRRTAESIRTHGYDMSAPPIPVDRDCELLNGAHRLSACVAYGKPCVVVETNEGRAGGSEWPAFKRGGIDPAVEAFGIRAYLALAPDGRLAEQFGSAENWPERPFPDWTARARGEIWRTIPWRILRWRYLLVAKWRTGYRREKSLKNADICLHWTRSRRALAEYLSSRNIVADNQQGERLDRHSPFG